MSPRSLKLLETSVVSAFVSLGVAVAFLHATETPAPAPVVTQACESQDVLAPFLRTAIEADAAFSAAGDFDEMDAFRVEGFYAQYVSAHEKLEASSPAQWAQTRVEALQQLQKDIAEMKKLEKLAKALEEKQAHKQNLEAEHAGLAARKAAE